VKLAKRNATLDLLVQSSKENRLSCSSSRWFVVI